MSDATADFLRGGATATAPMTAYGQGSGDPTADFLRAGASVDNKPSKAAPATQKEADNAPQGNDAGAGAAFVNGYNRAVPFGNKITSGMAAVGAKVAGADGSIPELYNQAQADAETTADKHKLASGLGLGAGIVTSIPVFKGATTALTGALDGTVAAPAVDYLSGLGKTPEDAGLVSKATNIGIRSAKGAAMAAPVAAAYGAGEAKPGQAVQGAEDAAKVAALVGAGIPIAGAGASALADAVTPKVSEASQALGQLAQKYNIPLSLDQISNSKVLKNVQKVSQELPFSGQSGFRESQMSAFNKALMNTVGVDADKITPEVMNQAFKKVGGEFDALGAGKTFNLGNDFKQKFGDIMDDAQITSTADARQNLQNAYDMVMKNVDENGNISGETLGKVRAKLNSLSRKASSQDTGDLLHSLENNVVDTMTEGDDAASGAFSDTKQKYKNLLAIEPLAAKAKGGNISPALLANRVSNIYGRAYTTGNAGEIGDLARIGGELLPELGGSDTTQKMIYAAGAGGGALANLPATVGTLAANRVYQSAINRNQGLVKKLLSPAEIAKLPPPEAMQYLKNLSASQAGAQYTKNNK